MTRSPRAAAKLCRSCSAPIGVLSSWLRFAIGVVFAGLVVILPSRAAIGDDLLPQTSTPWYYAAVARGGVHSAELAVSLTHTDDVAGAVAILR